nr:hypothetical protein Itr_chr06CG11140 [Ipomoea trifida]
MGRVEYCKLGEQMKNRPTDSIDRLEEQIAGSRRKNQSRSSLTGFHGPRTMNQGIRSGKHKYTGTIGTPLSKHKPMMRRAYLRQPEELPYAVSSNWTPWTQNPLPGNHRRQ